jgi:hypothetical protein
MILKSIGHTLRINCLLCDPIEEEMTKIKGVGRTQLLDDLRNGRRYWELKEEAEDGERWKDDRLSFEYKEEIHVIVHKSKDLIISSILNNNNNNDNNTM